MAIISRLEVLENTKRVLEEANKETCKEYFQITEELKELKRNAKTKGK